jgi:serine/threonine protein kinase
MGAKTSQGNVLNLAELATLFPDYEQFREISRSGQKEVVSATKRADQQRVAIKLFHKTNDDQARIDREIAAVVKLRCPFVPAVFASGQVEFEGQDRVFLIEQFISGQTYRAILRATPVQALSDVLEVTSVLLRACSDCEVQGLVHRDLKPENLMRDTEGRIWLLDFGLVRHLDLTTLTPTAAGVGTLGYAPLEQLRVVAADVNTRADLFAIGTIMYESLHGTNGWSEGCRDHHEIVRKMSTQELPRLNIPGDDSGQLSDFIGWLTQRYPSRRPQTAAEALAAFEPLYRRLRAPDV